MTILEFIEGNHLKKVALAQAAGVSVSTFSKFIRGWGPLPRRSVAPLAAALGVSVLEIETNDIDQSRATHTERCPTCGAHIQ